MQEDQDTTIKGRREFLAKGIAAGALSLMATSCMSHDKMHHKTGEKVKLLSPEGEIVEVDSGDLQPIPDEMYAISENIREGVPNRKFVMVIDLARCKNLRKCHDACEKIHFLPPDKNWLKVLKMQNSEDSAPYWQPTNCFHCDRPPCVKVCPVNATYKDRKSTRLNSSHRLLSRMTSYA